MRYKQMAKFRYGFMLVLLFFTTKQIKAQLFGANLGLGYTWFLGDLGGKKTFGTNDPSDLDIPSTRYAVSAGFKIVPVKNFAIRINAMYGRVYGDDKYTTNIERNTRNLSFFSNIAEVSATLQLNILPSKRCYIFAGLGFMHFNPKTRLNNQVIALQPLGTEGQFFIPGKSPYKLTGMVIPFGIGYRLYTFGNGAYLTGEYNFRKTFTDYIDDVSTTYPNKAQLLASNGQAAVDASDRSKPGVIYKFSDPGSIRGDSKNNDNYSFFLLSYNFPIGQKARDASFFEGGKRRGGSKKCPDMTY